MKQVRRIIDSSLFKNISLIIFGSGLSQFIAILSIPIVTRLYSPESFGTFGIVMAVTSVLATIVSGRFNIAVMLPRQHIRAQAIFDLAILTAWFTSILCMLFLVLSSSFANLNAVFWLLPFLMLVLGLQQSIETWVSRHKNFKLISFSIILGTLGGVLFKILLGFVFVKSDIDSSLWGGFGLLFGTLFTSLITAFYLKKGSDLKFIPKFVFFNPKQKVLLKKYKHMPLYRAPKDAINAISQNLPALCLTLFFGATATGFYIVAERLMKAPVLLLGNALRKVLFQKFTELNHQDISPIHLAIKMTQVLIFVAIMPFILISFWGSDLFEFLLGSVWLDAGNYVKWLALWMFFALINIPAMTLIPIYELEDFFFIYELVSLMLRFGGFLFSYYLLNSDELAVAAYCLISALANGVLILLVIFLSKKSRGVNV